MTGRFSTFDEAIKRLRELARMDDYETAHGEADEVLLCLIDDDEIREAFGAVGKWYA